MISNCIQSSEIVSVDNKKYLAIYLKQDFIPFVNVEGISIQHNPILMQEPCMSDMNDINVLSVILNKLCGLVQEREVNLLKAFNDVELIEQLGQKIKEHYKTADNAEPQAKDMADGEMVRRVILDIFRSSNNYMSETDNYFTMLDKFRAFIGKKIGYDMQGTFTRKALLDDDTYTEYFRTIQPGDFYMLYEELIVVYISFFLGFFRSRELYHIVSWR